MSNPVADTAEYFSEREKNNSNNAKLKKPPTGLKIFPSQEQSTPTHDLLFSPESPESRRPPPLHQSMSEFDPKLQWQKIVKRLPNRKYSSHSRRSSQDNMNASDDSDHEEYELNNRRKSVQYIPPNEEDDILPSADEIKSTDNTESKQEEQQDKNYFVNPFDQSIDNIPVTMDVANDVEKKKKKKTKLTTGTSTISSSSSSSISSSHHTRHETTSTGTPATTSTAVVTNEEEVVPGGGRAKKHWGKTLDKVRLIANLQTLPHQPKPSTSIDSTSSSLAPYYPPLFDPVFIALSKDPHGHPWVSKNKLLLYIT